jgi:hypothetical protein
MGGKGSDGRGGIPLVHFCRLIGSGCSNVDIALHVLTQLRQNSETCMLFIHTKNG